MYCFVFLSNPDLYEAIIPAYYAIKVLFSLSLALVTVSLYIIHFHLKSGFLKSFVSFTNTQVHGLEKRIFFMVKMILNHSSHVVFFLFFF